MVTCCAPSLEGATCACAACRCTTAKSTSAEAGQRVAVALPGVAARRAAARRRPRRPRCVSPSYRLDVELEELAPIPRECSSTTGPRRASRAWSGRAASPNFGSTRPSSPPAATASCCAPARPSVEAASSTPRRRATRTPTGSSAPRAERCSCMRRFVTRRAAGSSRRSGSRSCASRSSATWPRRSARSGRTGADSAVGGATCLPQLGLERRGAKLYRPGAAGSLGEREHEAAELEARLGLEPVKVEDAGLARFLEEHGRLVRVGDGYAVSAAAYERRPSGARREMRGAGRITLARFRDLLGTSRKTSQLLLERFDADGDHPPRRRRTRASTHRSARERRLGRSADLKPQHVRAVIVPGRVKALARFVQPLRIEVGVQERLPRPRAGRRGSCRPERGSRNRLFRPARHPRRAGRRRGSWTRAGTRSS